MNTIPLHHRWPAEGSAQQHWQEKVVEDQIFGRSVLGQCFILFYLNAGFEEDVSLL